MLDIIIPAREFYNEETNEFYYSKETELHMEHSLISISKWESKWHKAFMSKRKRTSEETLDYFRCMTINKVDPDVFNNLTTSNVEEIIDYINAPMTATYIGNEGSGSSGGIRSGDTTTSELLYYYMVSFGIPFECERWHINRLLALIHVCEVKNRPSKSINRSELNRRNNALNAARRKKYQTRG